MSKKPIIKSMNIKENKSRFIVAVIAAVFVIFVGILGIAANIEKFKPHTRVAFYGMNEVQSGAIKQVLESVKNSKGKKNLYYYTEFDSSLSLNSQLKKKYDLVFAPSGKNLKDAINSIKIKKAFYNSKEFVDLFTSSMIEKAEEYSINNDGKIFAVPLFCDNVEILYNKNTYNKDYSLDGVLFAGADDEMLLNTFGAIIECVQGFEAVLKAEEKIATEKNYYSEDFIAEIFEKDLKPSVEELKRLLNSDDRTRACMNYTENDLSSLIEQDGVKKMINTLSFHRTLDLKKIRSYKSLCELTNENSVYFPAINKVGKRKLSAQTYCVLPMKSKKQLKTICDALIQKDNQTILSSETGLGPVVAQCQIPDLEADDVRYWIAATSSPLDFFSNAAFTTKEQRKTFAEILRSKIN